MIEIAYSLESLILIMIDFVVTQLLISHFCWPPHDQLELEETGIHSNPFLEKKVLWWQAFSIT